MVTVNTMGVSSNRKGLLRKDMYLAFFPFPHYNDFGVSSGRSAVLPVSPVSRFTHIGYPGGTRGGWRHFLLLWDI